MKKIAILTMTILGLIGAVIVYHSFEGGVTHEENAGYTFGNDWLNNHNIFVFGTPPLDYLSAVNATGITWALYDQNYVDNLHNNGFKVCSGPGMISGIVTDNQSLRELARCMDINGNPAYFGAQYYMCHNNAAWRDFLKNKVKEHVDREVDVIHIDETGAVGDLSTSGFCDYCMAGFRSHLAQYYSSLELRDIFGIDNIDSFNYRIYLLSHGAQSAWQDPNQNLLREYFRFQYSSKHSLVVEMIQNAREYAGQYLLFSANTYGLAPDHQIYVPLFDFAVFELPMGPLPAGKHFTTYLLGKAMAPSKPFVAFPGPEDWAFLSQEDWWLWRHWLAEAYACGESFLIPYEAFTYGGDKYTLAADKIASYTNFITTHPGYYENISRVAKVAVLFDFRSNFNGWAPASAWQAWDNFENIGHALQEAHIPFEIVYVGDNEFIDKPITLGDLEKYSVVVVPSYYQLVATTTDLLNQYSLMDGEIVWSNNIPVGSDLVAEVRGTGVDLGLETNTSKDLSIVVYERENSLLAHIINYDYDNSAHDFTPQTNIEVTLTIPANVNLTGKTLRLLSPDAEQETILEYEIQGGKVTFTVPSVHEYSVTSFE